MLTCRYLLAWMGFLGFLLNYANRINLSMALVAIVETQRDNTTVDLTNTGTEDNATTRRTDRKATSAPNSTVDIWDGNNSTVLSGSDLSWDERERGMLLGSYYYGYTIMQLPSAWLSTKYGFRRCSGYFTLAAALTTSLFPLAVRLNLWVAVVNQFFLGVFSAVTATSLHTAWGAWAPPLERSRLLGISVAGASVGTCLSFYLGGIMIQRCGWESVFYLTALFSLVWVVGWFAWVYDSPASHPRISEEEAAFIQSSLGETHHRVSSPPWRSILTSLPVWAIIVAHAAGSWGNYTVIQQLPAYLTGVLGFDIELSGVVTSCGYILQTIVCLSGGVVCDLLTTNNILTTQSVRKINTVLGLSVPGIGIALTGHLATTLPSAVVFSVIAAGFNSFNDFGCRPNIVEIAPAYSGIVYGIANTVASSTGFLAPQLAGFLLTENHLLNWKRVFWLSGLTQILGSLPFLVCGTAHIQAWAQQPDKSPAGASCQGLRDNRDKLAVLSGAELLEPLALVDPSNLAVYINSGKDSDMSSESVKEADGSFESYEDDSDKEGVRFYEPM